MSRFGRDSSIKEYLIYFRNAASEWELYSPWPHIGRNKADARRIVSIYPNFAWLFANCETKLEEVPDDYIDP